MLAGIHFLNLKAMLDTEQTAYATLDFYEDRVVVNGVGRQDSRVLSIVQRDAAGSSLAGQGAQTNKRQ
jgi:hypothetical protein